MTFLSAIPALPVRDIDQAIAHYRDRLGFALVHADGGFAALQRDEVHLHIWEANDPTTPGAEPFIAGTASCRIQVTDIDALFAEMTAAGVVHPNSTLATQWWGVRDFTTIDPDNNCMTLYEIVSRTTRQMRCDKST